MNSIVEETFDGCQFSFNFSRRCGIMQPIQVWCDLTPSPPRTSITDWSQYTVHGSPVPIINPGNRPRGWSLAWRMLGSSAIVAGSLVLSLAIYFSFLGSDLMEVVARLTANWTSVALNLFGSSTSTNGTILASDDFAVNIVAECTAVGPLVLFTSAVIAYPSALRDKGLGLFLGLLVLSLVNLLRIMSLFWIGSAYRKYLDMAHLLIWQTGNYSARDNSVAILGREGCRC